MLSIFYNSTSGYYRDKYVDAGELTFFQSTISGEKYLNADRWDDRKEIDPK